MRGSGRCGFPWTARAWMRCRPRLGVLGLFGGLGALFHRDGFGTNAAQVGMVAAGEPGQAAQWPQARPSCGVSQSRLAAAATAKSSLPMPARPCTSHAWAKRSRLPSQLRAVSSCQGRNCGALTGLASCSRNRCQFSCGHLRMDEAHHARPSIRPAGRLPARPGSRRWNGWNRSGGYGPDPPWRDHGRPRGCARRRPRPRARNGLVRASRRR